MLSDNLWATIGFHLAFQWVTQFISAAVLDGSLLIAEQPTFELLVFWFFPIVLGSIALIAVSIVRGGVGWRESEPNSPVAAVRPS